VVGERGEGMESVRLLFLQVGAAFSFSLCASTIVASMSTGIRSPSAPGARSPASDGDLGTADGTVHGKGAFGLVRTGLSTSPILPGQRRFLYANDQARPITGESLRLTGQLG
jgi:hypothetical protein